MACPLGKNLKLYLRKEKLGIKMYNAPFLYNSNLKKMELTHEIKKSSDISVCSGFSVCPFFIVVVFLIQMDFCKAFCTSENTCGKYQLNFCQGGISDTKTHSV